MHACHSTFTGRRRLNSGRIQEHWPEIIADPVIADAIRNQLQHTTLILTITGEGYGGVKGGRLAARSNDRQDVVVHGSGDFPPQVGNNSENRLVPLTEVACSGKHSGKLRQQVV